MNIAIGADHRGFALKVELMAALAAEGHAVEDVGASAIDPADDYPDYAYPVALLVSSGEAERGILACGSGTGMAIAANKVAGIRAVEGSSEAHVRAARCDDDVNVLALSADELSPGDALAIARAFLAEPFKGGERYERRLDEIAEMEHDGRDEASHD